MAENSVIGWTDKSFTQEIVDDLDAMQTCEWGYLYSDQRFAGALYMLRCLANPKCAGSAEAVKAILEKRDKAREADDGGE